MKNCTKCGEAKRLDAFYNRSLSADGKTTRCKICHDVETRDYVSKNLTNVKKYKAGHYQANKVRYNVANNQWGKDNPDKVSKSNAKYRAKNPEKKAAHSAVGYAIKTGSLVRQSCEVCGTVKAHAHHDDYTKPLDVRWLCHTHHMQHHAKQEQET